MDDPSLRNEVDLLELLAAGYQFLRKNTLIILVFIAIGLLSGLSASLFLAPKWTSNMMISTDLIAESESKFILDELSTTRAFPDLSKAQKNEIIKLDFFPIKDQESGWSPMHISFNAIVSDTLILPSLEKSILLYINECEPVMRRRVKQEKYLSEMIGQINQELEILKNNKQPNIQSILPFDSQPKTIELFERRVNLEASLKEIQSIQVIKNFGKPTRADKPLLLWMIFGFAGGLLLSFIVLAWWKFNLFYKKFTQQNPSV